MAKPIVAPAAEWIKTCLGALSGLKLEERLSALDVSWNRMVPAEIIRSLLCGLWMRARSVAQVIELSPLTGYQLPTKGTYRFLNQRLLDLRELLRSYFTAETTTADDAILVDDTPSKRTGLQLPGVSFLYSTTAKAKVLGYGLVTLFQYGVRLSGFSDFEVKISDAKPDQAKRRGCPIKEIRRAKKMTKYELVLDMLDRARALGNQARLLIFDSWYGQSVDFLWELLRRHFHFITRLKTGRSLWHDGEYQKVDAIFRKLKKFKRLNDRTKYVAWKSSLPDFGDVWAIFVKFTDKHGGKHKAVVISDLMDWAPDRILERYLDRARIEQGYKVTKHDLGLSDAHLGSFAGQINEMALTFLAYLVASQVRLVAGAPATVAGVLLRARLAWAVWAQVVVLQLLWRRATKYSPETMIRAGLVQSWIAETMMTTAQT